jgi:putative phosphoribosyl transferase
MLNNSAMLYKNRKDAGIALAEKLKKYEHENPVILALPRGGVVLGYEVARALKAPLDVVVPRKIGAPQNPEFGIGAIAPNGTIVLNDEAVEMMGISGQMLEQIIEKETLEMNRRINLYRKNLPDLDLNYFKGKTAIVVDDGIATGVTTLAAVHSIKLLKPKRIILAVPICPTGVGAKFEVDEFICLNAMANFYAVGAYYKNFDQTTDEEVVDLLQRANLQ